MAESRELTDSHIRAQEAQTEHAAFAAGAAAGENFLLDACFRRRVVPLGEKRPPVDAVEETVLVGAQGRAGGGQPDGFAPTRSGAHQVGAQAHGHQPEADFPGPGGGDGHVALRDARLHHFFQDFRAAALPAARTPPGARVTVFSHKRRRFRHLHHLKRNGLSLRQHIVGHADGHHPLAAAPREGGSPLEETDPLHEVAAGQGQDDVLLGVEMIVERALGIFHALGQAVEVQSQIAVRDQQVLGGVEDQILAPTQVAFASESGGHERTVS